MDKSFSTDNTSKKTANRSKPIEQQKWRTFIDERPCVIPSIVNYHQRQIITTDYYNLTNSSEPIRRLDYFSSPILEIDQNVIIDPNSNIAAYDPHSAVQVVMNEPDDFSAQTFNYYPLKYLKSQSITDSIEHKVPVSAIKLINSVEGEVLVTDSGVNNKIERAISPSISNLVNLSTENEVTAPNSSQTHFVLCKVSTSVSNVNDENIGPIDLTRESEINKNQLLASGATVSGYMVPADASSLFTLVASKETMSVSSLNKENNEPVDLTTEFEINRQYYRHFKKKRAKMEENIKKSTKRADGSSKGNKNGGADSTAKYFKHNKLNRVVKHSTAVIEIPALVNQDEVQKLPFKEQISHGK